MCQLILKRRTAHSGSEKITSVSLCFMSIKTNSVDGMNDQVAQMGELHTYIAVKVLLQVINGAADRLQKTNVGIIFRKNRDGENIKNLWPQNHNLPLMAEMTLSQKEEIPIADTICHCHQTNLSRLPQRSNGTDSRTRPVSCRRCSWKSGAFSPVPDRYP